MTKKFTKKEMFAILREVVEVTEVANKIELLEFLDHEVELLNKKVSRSTQSKTQKANEELMNKLEIALAEMDSPVTISDFQEKSESEVALLSNQKLSALLKKLVEDRKTVVKTVKKKKSYFSVVRE